MNGKLSSASLSVVLFDFQLSALPCLVLLVQRQRDVMLSKFTCSCLGPCHVLRSYCNTDLHPEHRHLSQLEAIKLYLKGKEPLLQCEYTCPRHLLCTGGGCSVSVHACPAPPVPSAREAVLWRGLPDTEIQPGISFLWEQATGGHAHHGDVWPVCCMACGWRRAGTVGIASAGPSPDQRVGAAGASWAGGAGPWPSQGSASQCGGSH